MPKIPDPKEIIPEQLKQDNWTFFVMASSNDPSVKCQSIDDLVSSLYSTMEKAGLLYDNTIEELYMIKRNTKSGEEVLVHARTLFEFFQWQTKGANKAWQLYTASKGSPENLGAAVELANGVRRAVMFLVYDDRFTTSNANSFAARVT